MTRMDHLTELWSWQKNGDYFFSFELSKPSKLKFRAMQYSNIDSETENGSSAKRHLGGGRDIHLKMLIPRCLLPLCWSWGKKSLCFLRNGCTVQCAVSGQILIFEFHSSAMSLATSLEKGERQSQSFEDLRAPTL